MNLSKPRPSWNLDPVPGMDTTTWSVEQAETPVSWASSDPSIVTATVDRGDSTKVILQALAPGEVTISATDGSGATVSRSLSVGRILAYGPDGVLYQLQAAHWEPLPESRRSARVPDKRRMDEAGAGLALVPEDDDAVNVTCYVLNFSRLPADSDVTLYKIRR